MSNNESRPWMWATDEELRERIVKSRARLVTTGGHTKRQRITDRIEALRDELARRKEAEDIGGYADYLENIYGEDR